MHSFEMSQQRLLLIAAFLSCTSLASCSNPDRSLRGGPLDGTVVDGTTREPIVGAIVVGEWQGSRRGLVESRTIDYHAETAVTDAQGRFHIKAWETPNIGDTSNRIVESKEFVWAFAAGYNVGLSSEPHPSTILMLPYRGTRADRFEYLFRLAADRWGYYDNSVKNLIPLKLAVLNEARVTAHSAEEQFVALQIEWRLNELCSMPPGQILYDSANETPPISPRVPWPPPPCSNSQLQER